MTITRDREHIYTVEGRGKKPSVSKVLDLYFPPSPWFTEEGRERGQARHLWYNAIAQGLEITSEPDERIAAEVAGFRKFWAEVKPVYCFGEVMLFDEVLDVCGTPDMYCVIQGRPSVMDFKPRNTQERWKVQTAAYHCLLTANSFPVLDRYALRLLNGNYGLDQHKDRNDLACWRNFVAGYRARGFYGK